MKKLLTITLPVLFFCFFFFNLFLSTSALAQNHIINYSPTISFSYTDEKMFVADMDGNAHQDIVAYSTGTVTVLLHNGNNTVNGMAFNNPFTETISAPQILLDVKPFDVLDNKADLMTYTTGTTYMDFYLYKSTGTSFNAALSLSSTLPNATYLFGTIDINGDGRYEIYALNKTNATIFFGTLDLINNEVDFISLGSLPSVTSTSTVHLFTGHFQSA